MERRRERKKEKKTEPPQVKGMLSNMLYYKYEQEKCLGNTRSCCCFVVGGGGGGGLHGSKYFMKYFCDAQSGKGEERDLGFLSRLLSQFFFFFFKFGQEVSRLQTNAAAVAAARKGIFGPSCYFGERFEEKNTPRLDIKR